MPDALTTAACGTSGERLSRPRPGLIGAYSQSLTTSTHGSSPTESMIPKYLTLLFATMFIFNYLVHRKILSERKLAKWGLQEEQVFSRNVTLMSFSCWTRESVSNVTIHT